MRIKSIEVKNFKSLIDFRLDLPKFCCLVGLNGSGKSTVLQCVDFLAQLVRGDLDGWLRQRRWRHGDVLSKLQRARTVSFEVRIVDDQAQGEIAWSGTYNPYLLFCTAERLKTPEAELTVQGGQLSIRGSLHPVASERTLAAIEQAIAFNYQGSVLSQFREDALPPSLAQIRRFLIGTESLDMLTPEHLRQRTREAGGSLGHGGRNLSAFVHDLAPGDRASLAETLREAYPQLSEIISRSIQSGWKELVIAEEFGRGPVLFTESRHLSGGMLRLIAVIAELRSAHGLLLFDEIENGINPELVRLLVTWLVTARQQVVATTHSPMILNYLDDEVARQSIMLLYKTSAGRTEARRLFDIPSMAEKLTFMGAGEAFVDTDLVALSAEVAGRPAGV